MKAIYYNGKEVCREPENPRDCIENFNKITDIDYMTLAYEYADNHLSSRDAVEGGEEYVMEELDNAIWDGWYEWLEVKEVSNDDGSEEVKSEGGTSEKLLSYDVPFGAIPGIVGFNKQMSIGALNFKPLDKPGHMTRGCPLCDGMLKVLGVSETMGRMPKLYPCICQKSGCSIVVAEDEGYGPIVDDE